MVADETPVGGHQHDDREVATGEVLLITQILVCGDQRGEALCLGRREKVAIRQRLPSPLEGGDDLVTPKGVPQGGRGTLVE